MRLNHQVTKDTKLMQGATEITETQSPPVDASLCDATATETNCKNSSRDRRISSVLSPGRNVKRTSAKEVTNFLARAATCIPFFRLDIREILIRFRETLEK